MITKNMNWTNFNECEPPFDDDILMQIDIDDYVVLIRMRSDTYIVGWNHDVIDKKRFVRWIKL